jgi:hypothetical protein
MNIWLYIIDAIFNILNIIINFLPDVDTNIVSFINGSIDTLKGYLIPLSYIIPVYTLFTLLGFILLIESGIFLFKISLWVGSNITAGFIKK